MVLDVKAAPEATLDLAARFRRIPTHAFSAFRADDGRLLTACQAAGMAGILIEGVDNPVAGEWVAARTAQAARREALRDAPRLLRLTERLQLAAWETTVASAGMPLRTGDLARTLRVSREHLSREFGAGGAPNLKRVLDLVRVICAADLLGNSGYAVRAVARILEYASPAHLAAAARRIGGATTTELRTLGARGVLGRFLRGRTRSRV
ncbi:MAG: helix-turn-helix domain-containing protein [Burkholderiales bacterium]